MGTRLLLTEGGVAGHMAHLYDNGELTFAKIKEIFSAASNGELQGTEKTDGQNLFISYSVKNGNARAARNKGNIKQGGLTAQELASKFEGRGGLTEAFVESFETFEKAVRSLDPQTQIEIFGNDADIYYNAEIMDPRSPNVVNYDTKSLVIHQVGHGEYDKNTGSKTDRDVSANAKVLQSALETMQQATAEDDYTVQINAVRQLEALEDDMALQDALDALDALQKSTGASDKSTINDFMIARLAPHVENTLPMVGEDIHKLVLQRLMKAGVKFTQIVKGMDKETKEAVRAVVKDEKNLLKAAIAPLEVIIHDFSVEMLRGLQSAFILDNNKEIQRLRGEVKTAIDAIGSSNHEGALTLLKKQMEKLKDLENVSTASEGFVFDYDGQTYKFTGNFAPINQILGLFKYGRGDIPAMMKEEDLDQRDSDRYFGSMREDGGQKADVAIVPGAFKPPHRGHLAMVKYYTTMANKVVVWISPVSRFLPKEDGNNGEEITLDMAKKVWDIYLKNEGIAGSVVVEQSPHAAPVAAAYNYIGEVAQPGESVILGASTKPDKRDIPDYMRFKNASKYAGEGVTALHGPEWAVDHTMPEFTNPVTGNAYSASDFRATIARGDTEGLVAFLPDGLQGRAEEIINILNPKKVNESASLIIDLIKESMSENTAAGGLVVAVNKSACGKTKKYNPWDDEEEELYEKESGDHGGFEMDLETDVGIPREEMPQIKSTDMQDFIQWLEAEKQVKSQSSSMMVDDLKPTQKQINTDKIKGMLANKSIDELANSKPVLVTADNFLVDGHHRWFSLYINEPKNTISTVRVDLPLEEFLSVSREYPKVSYKSMVDENLVEQVVKALMERGYENFGGQTKMLKVGSVRIDIEDMELVPSKHGEERRFRHTGQRGGHKISKDAIISAVDRSLGLIMNDYANGELANGEAFHIRMKGKSNAVPALNVIAALDMQKGPDTIKIITVMRKDEFKTDNFGNKSGGKQKTYNVGA